MLSNTKMVNGKTTKKKKKEKIHRDATVEGMSGQSQNVFLEIEIVVRENIGKVDRRLGS